MRELGSAVIGHKSGWILLCTSLQKVFLMLNLLVAHFTMSVVEGEEYMYLPCSTRREKRPALSPAETVHMYTGDHIVALALDSSASVSFKS